MDKALTYLGTLPDNTVVHNGHEYTAGNLAFAKSIEPGNPALQRLADLVKKNNIMTGLTTMKDEKEWNVFMRLASDAVRQAPLYVSMIFTFDVWVRSAVSATAGTASSDIMNSLRDMKNGFRG
jgi:hydroxyacylglutathione hydrolase